MKLPASAFMSPKLGYKPHALEIGLASLSINILSLAMSLVTMQVYDRILVYRNIATLDLLCIGAGVAVLTEAALKLCRSYCICRAASVFEHTVSCNAVRHTLAQDANETENIGIGEYLQRVDAIGKIRDFYSGQSLATLIDLPFIFIFLAIIYHLGGILVLAPTILLVVMGLLAFKLGAGLKKSLIHRNKTDDNRYEFLIHALTGIHTVKSFGLEAPFERRYEKFQSASTVANFNVAALSSAAYDQGIISSHAMMILIATVGAPLVLAGEITLGALIACVMLSGRIMQPVQRALGFWTNLQDIEIARKKITDHFSGEEITALLPPSSDKKNGRVEIRDVSFSYDDQEKALDNVNLTLNPGEVIAISGEYGAGKQTLLKLIAGMHKPDSGKISVNNIEPHLLKSEDLISHVGYLPPAGVVFKGTIAENLSRFGRISEERVREMASLLGLDQEIAVMPAGYETALEGGNSDAIPPGLRQRIAIARILAEKPRVILFYNADRALDKEGYNNVYRLLGRLKGRVTMILVSNDRNILQLADKHYHLEQGKLKEDTDSEAYIHNIHPYQEVRL